MFKIKKNISAENFLTKCRENKLKITPQRVTVYEELASIDDHPSANTVYQRVKKKIPNISFDTINRTLLTFSKIGIVNLVEGYGEPKRFDYDVRNHHHFWCKRCNQIIDFYGDFFKDTHTPKELEALKVTILNKKIIFEGICNSCK